MVTFFSTTPFFAITLYSFPTQRELEMDMSSTVVPRRDFMPPINASSLMVVV
jgi:hypothetical protein